MSTTENCNCEQSLKLIEILAEVKEMADKWKNLKIDNWPEKERFAGVAYRHVGEILNNILQKVGELNVRK